MFWLMNIVVWLPVPSFRNVCPWKIYAHNSLSHIILYGTRMYIIFPEEVRYYTMKGESWSL